MFKEKFIAIIRTSLQHERRFIASAAVLDKNLTIDTNMDFNQAGKHYKQLDCWQVKDVWNQYSFDEQSEMIDSVCDLMIIMDGLGGTNNAIAATQLFATVTDMFTFNDFYAEVTEHFIQPINYALVFPAELVLEKECKLYNALVALRANGVSLLKKVDDHDRRQR